MDENLKRLVEELRNETCPQRVLDEVARRLPRNAPSRLRIELAVAIVAAVVLSGLALWRLPADRTAHEKPNAGSPVAMDSARTAQQAKVALGCLGAALREAGTRSEEVILKTAVPPLRNSLQTAKNKIINHI
jgi:hypothetical protein